MDTIKSYLETMFANLPATTEVLKAKDELWGMMEDKYNELISEGKSENEAVGTVISEFGNLDELAETLGLNRQSSAPVDNRRTLTQDEARSFVSAGSRHAFLTALGVFLCIFSVVPAAACSAFHNNFLQTMGTVALFIIVACGVGIFIITNSLMNKYDYIKKHECIIDYATVGYVQDKKEQLRNISIVCRTLGIIMCIISFVPAAVFDAIPIQGLDDIGGAAMVCIVSIGVFLIVFGSMAETSCKTLLALNGDNVAGSYVKKENKEVRYINNTATTIMSVFWQSSRTLSPKKPFPKAFLASSSFSTSGVWFFKYLQSFSKSLSLLKKLSTFSLSIPKKTSTMLALYPFLLKDSHTLVLVRIDISLSVLVPPANTTIFIINPLFHTQSLIV